MRVVNDRRSSTRVTVRGEALVHTPQGPTQCRCLDISPTGMSLVSPRPVKPGQRVHIEASFKGQRLVLDARVIRRNRSRDGHVLGVRFDGLGVPARQQLAEVLRSMQVQATLAMHSSSFVDRLPVLQLPEAEPTERAPHVPRVPWPAPAAAPSTPKPGGTQEVPAMASARPRVETPKPGGTQEVPAMASARPRVETPERGGTLLIPPIPARIGLEDGWTEDELVTGHYRSSSERASRLVEPEPPAELEPVPAHHELANALVLDDTESSSSALSFDDAWALLELDDQPPPPSRGGTMPALASFATTSPATVDDEASAGGLGPVRTGKTLVIHVQDLIAAYAPPLEPPLELDLPEPTAPMTAPMPMPRLSDELQAALDRLRRRDDANANAIPRRPKASERDRAPEGPSAEPSRSARRHRRRDTTQVYAPTRREDAQVEPVYHGARAKLAGPDRGNGT
jgi:hypothetical protein